MAIPVLSDVTGLQSSEISDFATAVDARILTYTDTFNAQTGTTYTLVVADIGKLVTLSNAGAITLTVPTNAAQAIAVGKSINIAQIGAGQVTISGAGTTLNATPGLKTRAQFSVVTLLKTATDTWLVFGDLSA